MGGERGKGEGGKLALWDRRGEQQGSFWAGSRVEGRAMGRHSRRELCKRQAIGYHRKKGPINVGGGSFNSLRLLEAGLKINFRLLYTTRQAPQGREWPLATTGGGA